MFDENFIDGKREEKKKREMFSLMIYVFLCIYNMTKYTLHKIILILQDLRKWYYILSNGKSKGISSSDE
jgi:hypothetical protein